MGALPETEKDNRFTKWVRPSIITWLTILFTYLIVANHDAKESYISLLETIMVVAYTSYFVGRSSEKIFTIKSKDKSYSSESKYDEDMDEIFLDRRRRSYEPDNDDTY